MNQPEHSAIPDTRRRAIEMVVFLGVSALGIYALGIGLNGVFKPGRAADLVWLLVAGVATMVLFSQMGRVHDAWPRRDGVHHGPAQPSTSTDTQVSTRPAESGREGDET